MWLLVMFWNRFVRLANFFFVFISLQLAHFFISLCRLTQGSLQSVIPDDRKSPASFDIQDIGTVLAHNVKTHGFVENCHHVLDRTSILDDPSSVLRLEVCERSSASTLCHGQNRTRCIRDLKIHTHAASHIWIVAVNYLGQGEPTEPESTIGRSSCGSVDMKSAGSVLVFVMARM